MRKEVRLIGSSILLTATTMFGVIGLSQGFHTTNPGGAAMPTEGIEDTAPVISLSLEPIGTAPSVEIAAPVVRPAGYVLPDDGTEEGSHAGS